jgi:polyphosphate:AMP phosphotransferase
VFEAAELGQKVSKAVFEQTAQTLRTELLEVQRELRKTSFPVIVVLAGVDKAGKGEVVNILTQWMDPRWIAVHAYTQPSEEVRARPEFWRFWRDLPPQGKIGIFLSSWYSRPVLERVHGAIDRAQLDVALDRIVDFEQALADDGALVRKFWMHLDKPSQKKRFRKLEKDPLQAWRVTQTDWQHLELYDRFVEAAERTIMRTSTGQAPWKIVEGANLRYAYLTVGTLLRDAIRRHLELDALQKEMNAAAKQHPPAKRSKSKPSAAAKKAAKGKVPELPRGTILEALEMTRALPKPDYEVALKQQQGRLNLLWRRAQQDGINTILLFEGWDAAGKGGAIRRITAALDARDYQIIPIAAPTDEERAHHYLWRFWRHLPRAGRITIFDRTWYGRVLVERVEGFATEAEWMRGYAEINQFEEQLVEHGIVLVKYWLHITKEEQLRRFRERERTPFKRFKLTEEDWRNREKWDPYEQAVNAMVERTSTRVAPWTLVEANDKRYARVKVIATLCDRLQAALGRHRAPAPEEKETATKGKAKPAKSSGKAKGRGRARRA